MVKEEEIKCLSPLPNLDLEHPKIETRISNQKLITLIKTNCIIAKARKFTVSVTV